MPVDLPLLLKMTMKQLTPELREALIADMRSFFDNSQSDEALDFDETITDEIIQEN